MDNMTNTTLDRKKYGFELIHDFIALFVNFGLFLVFLYFRE